MFKLNINVLIINYHITYQFTLTSFNTELVRHMFVAFAIKKTLVASLSLQSMDAIYITTMLCLLSSLN